MRSAVLAIAALGALAGCCAPVTGAPGPTRTPTGESTDGRGGSGFAYPVSTTGGYGLLTRAHSGKVNVIYGGHAGMPKSQQPKRQIAEPPDAAPVQAAPLAVSPIETKIISPPTEQPASIAKQPSDVPPETLGSDDIPG
jgi:hypothetical protein